MSWPLITELGVAVSSGKTTALEQVQKALTKINENSEYNAVISILKDNALKRAKQIDDKIKNKKQVGRLAGVPFIAKDNFLVFGSDTTAGSNILRGFKAPYQATVIDKLEAEGAICVAKANLDAFGHGASTENSDFGTVLNPHDKTKVPGGSSGGSAVAVALEMVPFALGTDTGGSSRQPASFSGCVGYKPTYGLLSRNGIVAMASSTDTVGILSSNATDLGILTEIMSGKDPLDSTTIEREHSEYQKISDSSLKGVKVGVIKEYLEHGINNQVKEHVENYIDKLKDKGAEIVPVSLPSLKYALAVYYILVPAEISSNLSRYDGQRFGHTSENAKDLDASYLNSRSEGFGAEAKRRIMIGTYVLSSGYYDAYYRKAQLVRTKIINEFKNAFNKVDFLIGPTAPTTAFKIGQNAHDPLQMYLADLMTVGPSLVGIPAIVLPSGNVDDMPVGIQVMANQRKDKSLIDFSVALEKEIKT